MLLGRLVISVPEIHYMLLVISVPEIHYHVARSPGDICP